MTGTEAFTIDIMVQEDAPALCTLMVSNSERFSRYFPKTLAQNLTVEASNSFILRKIEEIESNVEFTYALRDYGTKIVAGLLILKNLDWDRKQGELAYCIGSNFERKGWITKAVKEMSNYAFKDLQLKTLQIIVHKSNKASTKVAEKCGFTWQKILEKAHTPPNEAALDMELYELYT